MAAKGLSKGGVYECWGVNGEYTVTPTFTCCHCNSIHEVPDASAMEVGFCARCFARECIDCAKRLSGRCLAFERQIDEYEKRHRQLVAIGIAPE